MTGSNLDQRIDLHGPRDELRELVDTFDGMLKRLDAELEVLAADPNAAVATCASTPSSRRQRYMRIGDC